MMMIAPSALGQLSDHDLLAQVHLASQAERRATAQLIALLMELDTRRLYLGEGFSSLFTYCTQALHLSEHAAYNRIETARAARRFPIILELVGEGAVTLTSIRLLAPHLTPDNHREVLERARHKTKRDVELLVASLNPRPDAISEEYRAQLSSSQPVRGRSIFPAGASAAVTRMSWRVRIGKATRSGNELPGSRTGLAGFHVG